MGKDKHGTGGATGAAAGEAPAEVRVSCVEVECVDNMATLPVGQHRQQGSDLAIAEKHNSANKEMELKNVQPKPTKRTSLFIIMSFIYAKLLVVICIAYVISDVITHNLPLYYYEGFFTYLYGMSILFLLYVFCFLLQESTCCSGSPPKPKPPPKEKKQKKEKEKKNKEKEKESKKEGKKKGDKNKDGDKDKDKDAGKEKHGKELKKPSQFQQDIVEVESAVTPRMCRKRKTTQNDHSHGSFFLRIGAIAFGLGTMIYNGLEFGTFFEVPFESPCYQILRGVNPVLQMVFTFMQMYFIFMNSRLNIHRFKVVARFGLMHVVATNLCVWIRTLVIESLKEITAYHIARKDQPEDSFILESIRLHTLRNAGTVLGQELGPPKAGPNISPTSFALPTTVKSIAAKTFNIIKTTAAIPTTTPSTTTTTLYPPYLFDKTPQSGLVKRIKNIIPSTRDPWFNAQPDPIDPWANDDPWTTSRNVQPVITTASPLNAITTTLSSTFNAGYQWFFSTAAPFLTTSTTNPAVQSNDNSIWKYPINNNLYEIDNAPPRTFAAASNENGTTDIFEALEPLLPAALVSNSSVTGIAQNCGRVNIMGTIVQDSAPYLYPFIIEYSLIGAAVIYVMWKHIGRYPRLVGEAELERRVEAAVARRAAALARARGAREGARVDCAGASKGLFCGLLLLVAALICLILFFVLVRHPRLGLLAVYLADVSHCTLMALSIFAIIVGFIRVQGLKFRSEEQSDLNDILLRVSAFGLFIYAVFSVIAGSLAAFTNEPNLLVMITGVLSVIQVVLQLLFIADVSRRRVHLPEQERSKPARQVVTFLLICNLTMWMIYTFEAQKVLANPVQLDFYGFLAWSIVQRVTLPLCIFHRFHSAVTLAEIWKTSYKARLE